MPKARGQRELTPAMLRFLSIGDTAGSSVADGHWAAFDLSGRVHKYLWQGYDHHRASIDEVRALYDEHKDEIDDAARVATGGRYLCYARRILAEADKLARGDDDEMNSNDER